MRLHTTFFILLFYFTFGNLVAEDWKLAGTYAKKADEYFQKKQYDKGIAELEKAENEWNKTGYYATRIGSAYSWYLNNYEKAIEAFERALAQDGDKSAWTLRETGFAYSKIKEYGKAENYLNKSIELAKETYEKNADKASATNELVAGYGILGNIYLQQEKYAKALETVENGYEISPSSNDWWLANGKTLSSFWLGHNAMAEENYSEAVKYYSLAEESYNNNPDFGKWAENSLELKNHREIAEKRNSLGRIRPDYIHKIFVIYIKNTDFNFKGLNGKNIIAQNTISQKEIEKAELIQKVLKAFVESLSDGHLSLEFERKESNSTVYEMDVSLWGGVQETRIPAWDSIKPDLGNLFFQNRKYDTFLLYWNGDNGVATTANGGGLGFPYIPYFSISALRGFISFPSNWIGETAPMTLLHEFFHNVEAMSGISPTHGFQDGVRKSFPGWTGKGQLSYFKWHFENTLPKVTNDPTLSAAEPTWKNLNWSNRYPETVTGEVFQKQKDYANQIDSEKLRSAAILVKQANDLFWRDNKKDKAGILYENAYMLNPYHPDVLRYKAENSHSKGDYINSEKYFATLAELKPELWILKFLVYLQHWKNKKLPDAIMTYDKIISSFPESVIDEVYVNYSRALIDAGRHEDAIYYLDKGIEVKNSKITPPTPIQSKFWKGYILGEKMNRPKDAYPLVKEAVENGYSDAYTQFFLKKFESATSVVAKRSLKSSLPPEFKQSFLPISEKPKLNEVKH